VKKKHIIYLLQAGEMTFGFGVNDGFIQRFRLHDLPEEVFHLPTLQGGLQYNALCFYLILCDTASHHFHPTNATENALR
jgi:hypothetical protein